MVLTPSQKAQHSSHRRCTAFAPGVLTNRMQKKPQTFYMPIESGVAEAMAPGLYPALLSGVNNGTGIGLVEVYDLQ